MDERTTNAQKRADAIYEVVDTNALKSLATLALNEPEPQRRVFWLHRLSDVLGDAARGKVVCDKGCSHCCYQPVMMSQTEAAYIAKHTGLKMSVPEKYSIVAQMQYLAQPCPLLKNGRCSVYEFRPFACRVHYSLDDTEDACKIVPGETIIAPYMDNMDFHLVEIEALGEHALQNADIRDFFKGE